MKTFDPMALRRIMAEIQTELNQLEALAQEWEAHRLGEWADTFFCAAKAPSFMISIARPE